MRHTRDLRRRSGTVSHLGESSWPRSARPTRAGNAAARRPRPLRIQAVDSAAATGADLLWRVKTTLRRAISRPCRRVLAGPDRPHLGNSPRQHRPPLNVRVIDYTLDDGRDNPEQYRLLTTILDPDQASATELARPTRSAGKSRASSTNSKPINADHGRCCARSPRRWCSRRSGGTCAAITPSARSCSTPHARRATRPRPNLLRRSTTCHPKIVVPQLFFPLTTIRCRRALEYAIGKLTQRLNPARRVRANPRVVKRKVLKWAAKRSHHHTMPQPQTAHRCTILIYLTERYCA